MTEVHKDWLKVILVGSVVALAIAWILPPIVGLPLYLLTHSGNDRLLDIGTTAMRCLESTYWIWVWPLLLASRIIPDFDTVNAGSDGLIGTIVFHVGWIMVGALGGVLWKTVADFVRRN